MELIKRIKCQTAVFFASAKGLRTLAGHLEEMADEADNFMRHVKEKPNE
jgi:hypothetical protein